MALIQTWRWYGPHDIVTLQEIEQTGATGIVNALHQIPVGQVWPLKDILERKRLIEWNEKENVPRNLTWEVVESVNVHEAIKMGTPERDQYIAHYQETIRNIAQAGISVICYNFMPVLDWTRTDLYFKEHDGSLALRFDMIALAAFDLFILCRAEAQSEYSQEIQALAKVYFESLNDDELNALQLNILAGLPGVHEPIPISIFREYLDRYKNIGHHELRNNLRYFLQQIIPVAEEVGVRMCIHPDDPPYQIFGLPRVMCCADDFQYLLDSVDSHSNGITFCTGSLGPHPRNDLPEIIQRFGHRIHFIHLRNVRRQEFGSFYEADHLGGSVDMYEVMYALIRESLKRQKAGLKDALIPMRPDHGHQMLDDMHKNIPFPGYSAIGRLRGLAELRGLEMGIERTIMKNE